MRYLKAAGAALAAALLGVALAALPATAAVPAVPVTSITATTSGGEAGYYAVDNGRTRFRYVQGTLQASTSLVDLNGTGAEGAVGLELCDPNTGHAFQLGIESPSAGVYVVEYGTGTLTGTYEDDCIQGGLLNGGTGTPIAGEGTAQPVATGDQVQLSIYYNPRARHHTVEFTVCDPDQTWGCRNPTVSTPPENFYEFGIGALTATPDLTAPASILLTQFTGAAANYYSSSRQFGSIHVPGHWNLRQGVLVNASSQPILSANSSLDSTGSEFDLSEGSTSP
jgi:hypothetical protein